MTSCDIPRIKFVEVDKSDVGFCLSQKPLSSVQSCDLKKISLIMTSRSPLGHSPEGGDQSYRV